MSASWHRSHLVNVCVAVASTAVAYLVMEFAVLPAVLPHVPLDRQIDIHAGIRALTQSSKSGTLPHDYVALVGDSYAQGSGDWFRSVDHGRNPPYNVTHLIYEREGRDSITFGASGAGSLRGLVTEPLSQYEFMKATGRFRIGQPDVTVVYFYEGNDLDNNVLDLETRYDGPWRSPGRAPDPVAFGAFMRDKVLGEDSLFGQAEAFRWYDNAFVADFIYRTIKRSARYWLRGREAYEFPLPVLRDGPNNRAVVGGAVVAIPEELQGPALELNGDEIGLGVDVFERALVFLRDWFADSRVCVVYIPSPLSCYEPGSPTVSCQSYHDRESVHPSSLVWERSDEIAGMVREVAERAGCPFADARPALRREAAREFIHGPLDWRHFNRNGLETLATTVIALVDSVGEAGPRDVCDE